MTVVPIPLPRLGVDLLSQETAIGAGCVRHAVNVDIDGNGQVRRRAGYQWIAGGQWSTLFDFGGNLIAQKGKQILRIHPQSLAQSIIAKVESHAAIDCTIYNQALYFVSRSALWRMGSQDDSADIAGVAAPALLPQVEAIANGKMPAGYCTVAVSWIDSSSLEESPAFIIGQVKIPSPSGGLVLSKLQQRANRRWRVYVTAPDGEVLYLTSTFDAVWPQYTIGDYPKGALCSTLHHRLMPGGEFVRGFKGRLLVANGATLYYSGALMPHLMHAASGFVAFASPIRFVECVAGGVFVGQADGVYFLAGDDPTQWHVQRASDAPPVACSSGLVAMQRLHLGEAGACALWLSAQGHMAGLPDGQVQPLNAKRIRCAPNAKGYSAVIERGGIAQFITLTNALTGAVSSLAQDTHNPKGFVP